MSFYANISKYYEYIFPVREPQKKFFSKHLETIPAKKVLDIACGTGSHTIELKKAGFNPIGVDLDATVIKKAEEIADRQGMDIQFQVANMLNLPFNDVEFGGVICIGNSLVHLLTTEDISKALEEMKRVLVQGGKLILQIVNYDRILDNNLKGLPPIENKEVNLLFERNYEFSSTDLIDFNTTLKVPEGEFKNSVKLKALRKNDLEKLIKNTGFKNIKVYGNFMEDNYNPDSFATIIVAEK